MNLTEGDTVIGIDGCRGGWVWWSLGGGASDQGTVARLSELLPRLRPARLALIDIPIGLKAEGPQERRCDREARILLGRPRASSVFRPPCRAALAAGDYRAACALNEARTGVRISRQTWNILPKIRETDALMAQAAWLKGLLREAHPEIAFWGLGSGIAMVHNKRREAGHRERLALLERFHPGAGAEIASARRLCPGPFGAPDDLADALALAVSAAMCSRTGMRTLPSEPETDAQGLDMEMVYALA